MKRVVIIAKGEVQRVGYRDAVEKIGRKLKLTGFVENLKPYDVRIVAEGEEETLNAFVAHVRITDHPIAPISVEELDVEFGAATGEFEYFEIRRGDWQDELGERMDAAGALLYRSLEIGEKMLEGQDKMLEKQDRTIEILEDVREDTGKIRDALPYIREIHSETVELRDKYEVLRMDVDAIKVKLEV